MAVTAYVLGMLTIVLTAMLTVIVVGIVKILKLQRQIKEMNLSYYRDIDHIHRRIEDSNSETWRQFELTGKDITMVDKTLQNKMENELKGVHTNTKRYIDSRIDKLVDTYFDMVGAKEIIKG